MPSIGDKKRKHQTSVVEIRCKSTTKKTKHWEREIPDVLENFIKLLSV